MSNFVAQGRAAYGRAEYPKAIECFDRAIGRTGASSSAQLLDNRAACYEKLNELSAALKDAKKAIQLHREDPTGYLRAGKVLLRMEKQSVALEIYTHGLRSVRHVGMGYEQLRKNHKELMDQLCPPKSVDPLTMLPRELAEVILEHLSFRQRINACLVSKQWAHFIRSCPNLWQHLDLSMARKKVKTAFMSRAINVGRSKLTAATLNWLWDFDKALAALVKHCPLEQLTLLETGLHSGNLIQALKPAKHLRKFNMGGNILFPVVCLPDLLEAMPPSLEAFECKTMIGASDRDGFAKLRSVTCHNLRKLSVTLNRSPTAHLLHAVVEGMPLIETLALHCGTSETVMPEPVDVQKCIHLRHLDLCMRFYGSFQLNLPETLVSLRLVQARHHAYCSTFFTHRHTGQTVPFFLPRLEVLRLDIQTMPIEDAAHALSLLGDASKDKDASETALKPSTLRELSLRSAKITGAQSISSLLCNARLNGLEHLSLPQLQGCADENVSQMLESLKATKAVSALRSLDLSETNITGVGIKEIVQSCHLEELVVNDCRLIGADAIEWARAQGLRVQCRMSDNGSGKKLRG